MAAIHHPLQILIHTTSTILKKSSFIDTFWKQKLFKTMYPLHSLSFLGGIYLTRKRHAFRSVFIDRADRLLSHGSIGREKHPRRLKLIRV